MPMGTHMGPTRGVLTGMLTATKAAGTLMGTGVTVALTATEATGTLTALRAARWERSRLRSR